MSGPLNGITDVCNAVDAAIKSLVGPNVDVQEARHNSLTFALKLRGDGIVWSYDGYSKVPPGSLGDRGRQPFSFRFTITVLGMDWSSPAGANTEAREMAETLRLSPADAQLDPSIRPNGLRTIPLGTVGADTIYLQFESENVVLDPNSTPQAGRVGFVQTWTTFPQVWV